MNQDQPPHVSGITDNETFKQCCALSPEIECECPLVSREQALRTHNSNRHHTLSWTEHLG